MKSQKDEYLPQSLRVEIVNEKMHNIVSNTAKGELNLYKDQNIGVVDLGSTWHYHVTKDSVQRYLHGRFMFLNEE